jgi:general secretion pathway protein K
MMRLRNRPCRKGCPADPARERGLALLVVLWIIASAALLISAFNATVRSGASFVASEIELTRMEALLDSGAEIAALHLIDEDEARRWSPDGGWHTVSFAGAKLAIAIDDPNGLIDINKADDQLLLQFLRKFAGSSSKAADLCHRIVRARGSSGETCKREAQTATSDGAGEADDESGEAPGFVDVAQLRHLEGMTIDIYRAIAPFLTVYARDGRINPLWAPAEVLSAIPNVAKIDIERMRASLRSGHEKDAALAEIMQRARSHLTDESGPAYMVSVVAQKPDGSYRSGKVFVIATGLDGGAPYRLIAKRPLALSN